MNATVSNHSQLWAEGDTWSFRFPFAPLEAFVK
jgi:hypothetical protein